MRSLLVEFFASLLFLLYVAYINVFTKRFFLFVQVLLGFAVAFFCIVVMQRFVLWRFNYAVLEVSDFLSSNFVYEIAEEFSSESTDRVNGKFKNNTDLFVTPHDTLFSILHKLKINNSDIDKSVALIAKNARKNPLYVGQKVSISYWCNVEYIPTKYNQNTGISANILPVLHYKNENCFISSISMISPAQDSRIVLSRAAENEKNDLIVKLLDVSTKTIEMGIGGAINNSLYYDAMKAGMSSNLLSQILEQYSFDIDFQRDVHRGDRFSFVFEKVVDESGEMIRYGKLLFSDLFLSGKHHILYNFNNSFVDEFGKINKKTLLKTPIDGARLSSGFGSRRHPILGYTRLHQGVDFAAPWGTPIYAAGDGVVTFVGKKSGYGNFIAIKHNEDFTTHYAHMKGFGNGIRVGARVSQRQIVGYVGATGLASGPHLHYEVVKRGIRINPTNCTFAGSYSVVAGKNKAAFNALVARMKKISTK